MALHKLSSGNIIEIKELLSNKMLLSINNNISPILLIIRHEDMTTMEKAFDECYKRNIYFTALDASNNTILHILAIDGNLKMILYILSNDYLPSSFLEKVNNSNQTPFHCYIASLKPIITTKISKLNSNDKQSIEYLAKCYDFEDNDCMESCIDKLKTFNNDVMFDKENMLLLFTKALTYDEQFNHKSYFYIDKNQKKKININNLYHTQYNGIYTKLSNLKPDYNSVWILGYNDVNTTKTPD